MRRRAKEAAAEGAPPLRLQRYRADEWDDDPQAFWDAQWAWRERHGEFVEMTEPGPDVPFDPYTNPV